MPESVTAMNHVLYFIGRSIIFVLTVSLFTHLFATSDASGCLLTPEPAPQTSFENVSSRRRPNQSPVPSELNQSDRTESDNLKLGSSPEQDKGDEEMGSDDTDTDSEVDDVTLADEDSEDSDDSTEQHIKPNVGIAALSTDTRSLRVNIAETNDTAPDDQSHELVAQSQGHDQILPSETRFAWAAPDIRYQPLYFENVPHERYGQTPEGCELRQTVLSTVHFFGSAALLPYKLIDQHRHSCDGPLGFCRPGSESPFVWQPPIVR